MSGRLADPGRISCAEDGMSSNSRFCPLDIKYLGRLWMNENSWLGCRIDGQNQNQIK
jgi:hypothetical protein